MAQSLHRTVLGIFWLIFAAGAFGADGVSGKPEAITAEYYRRSAGWFFPAKIGDREVLAALGTGSDVMVVHAPNGASDFPEYRLTMELHGRPLTPGSAPVFQNLPFSCLNQAVRTDAALSSDLTNVRKFIHVPVDLVIAMPYLRDLILRLDPGSRRIEVLCDRSLPFRGSPFPIEWNAKGIPQIAVEFPTIGSRPAQVETAGVFPIELSEERAGMLQRSGHLQRLSATDRLTQVNDRAYSRKGELLVLRWLKVGGTTFRNVPVTVSGADRIGLSMFNCFHATFDFPESTVWLAELPPKTTAPLTPNASGLQIRYSLTGELIVVSLLDGYSAENLDIQPGDRVLSLNGRTPEQLSRTEIDGILSEQGHTIHLQLQRDNHEMSRELRLKHLFDWPPKWPEEPPEFNP